jgi:hypothetical protein
MNDVKFSVSLVAREATMADGRPLVGGDTIELSPQQREDPHNARLIAEGQLISISNTDKAVDDAQRALDHRPTFVVPPPRETEPVADLSEGGTS